MLQDRFVYIKIGPYNTQASHQDKHKKCKHFGIQKLTGFNFIRLTTNKNSFNFRSLIINNIYLNPGGKKRNKRQRQIIIAVRPAFCYTLPTHVLDVFGVLIVGSFIVVLSSIIGFLLPEMLC